MSSKALSHISERIPFVSSSPFFAGARKPTPTNLKGYISPLQFARVAHDISMWREAIREMEQTFNPSRVRVQRMYMDVIENPWIKVLYDRYQELTTQRDYTVYQVKNGKRIQSDILTQNLAEQTWFGDYIEIVLDAPLYGYSLISLGDIVDNQFPNITSIQRENINPDGENQDGRPELMNMTYGINGISITDHPLISLCNHWIPTKSPRGVSTCGYGLLYNASLCEIHLRHILEWNMDFAEQYAQPIKKGFTSKTGKARAKFEAFLASGASNQWVLLDKGTNDNIEYTMADNAGTAWKTYDNIESRLKGVLAQMFLGHTDAMSSTPGKLGGMQAANKDGFNESLIEQAQNSKQIRYGNFTTRIINEVFAPKMRDLGKKVGSKAIANLIPEGYKFDLMNDKETNEIRRRLNADRLVTSQYVKMFNDGGYDVDLDQLSEHVGWKMTPSVPERKLTETRETMTTIKRLADENASTQSQDEQA